MIPSKYHRRKSVDEAGSSAAGLAKPAATKYHGREPVVVYLTFKAQEIVHRGCQESVEDGRFKCNRVNEI